MVKPQKFGSQRSQRYTKYIGLAFFVPLIKPSWELVASHEKMVQKHNQKNLQESEMIINEIWEELKDEVIESLCTSFLLGVTKCIAQQGDRIRCWFIYKFFNSKIFFVDCISSI